MPRAVPITRDDRAAAELREAAPRSNHADATRRMLHGWPSAAGGARTAGAKRVARTHPAVQASGDRIGARRMMDMVFRYGECRIRTRRTPANFTAPAASS